jgi:hypothetical protein
MLAGIKWRWETFPQFLDVLDSLPKGINYAGYMGHCALRTYVMGQRAFTDEASEDDLAKMVHHVKEAIGAGAIGFSTTRSVNHQTSDDKPVASRLATWQEFEALVKAMGAGLVEVAGEPSGADSDKARVYYEGLSKLAIETGRPITSAVQPAQMPGRQRTTFDIIRRTISRAAACSPGPRRALNVLLSFETQLPFDKWSWRGCAPSRSVSRRRRCSIPTCAAAGHRLASLRTRWCAAPRGRGGTGSSPWTDAGRTSRWPTGAPENTHRSS